MFRWRFSYKVNMRLRKKNVLRLLQNNVICEVQTAALPVHTGSAAVFSKIYEGALQPEDFAGIIKKEATGEVTGFICREKPFFHFV